MLLLVFLLVHACAKRVRMRLLRLLLGASLAGNAAGAASALDWISTGSTLVEAIATVVGIFVACLQLWQVKREVAQDYDWRRRMRTEELATYYGREVAPLITYFVRMYQDSGAMRLLDLIDDERMRRFTDDELRETQRLLAPVLPPGVGLVEAMEDALKEMPCERWRLCHGMVPEGLRLEIDPTIETGRLKKAYLDEAKLMRTELANRLISFCNAIDFDLVVEDLIYPLVHDSFFMGVRLCYCRIARSNVVGGHQHAYNVRRVFLTWRARQDEYVVTA